MIGRTRAPGRHRAGQALTTVHRRLWDGPARAEAERLERSRPGWVVLYGVGSRRFYAIAAWPVPEPVIVEAPTAEGLEERMGEAETALLLWSAPPGAAPVSAMTASARTRRRSRSPDTHSRAATPVRGLPYPPQESPFSLQGSAA